MEEDVGLAGSTAALAQPSAQRRFLATLRAHDWVVYAKRTLAGPEAVLDYLGRYTTKTALSNHRLLSLDAQGNVRFSWRDRAHGNRRRIRQLPAAQFLERFLLHVLPAGLVRIRHIGMLANRHKRQQLAQARAALAMPAPTPVPKESTQQFCVWVLGIDIERCPHCGLGHLRIVAQIPAAHAPYHARARHDPQHHPAPLNRSSLRARRPCAPTARIDPGIALCHSGRHLNCASRPSCQALACPPTRPHRLRATSWTSLGAFQSPYSGALNTAVQFN